MATSPLAVKIARDLVDEIEAGELLPGEHLRTEVLAQRFQVSRSPVREALRILREQKLIDQLHNRGFFVAEGAREAARQGDAAKALGDPEEAYFHFAEDWLNDRIPGDVTELFVKTRYDLSKSAALEMLSRAAREGWAAPKPGYGWRLLEVAKTPEAFEHIYRFRAVIEPAALLEPSFVLDFEVSEKLRRIQQKLLDGETRRLPSSALVHAGVDFHEELIRMSGNILFEQALARANQLRRLLEYRTNVGRAHFKAQCLDHLHILDLVESGDNVAAARFMKKHLERALEAKAPLVFDAGAAGGT